MLDPCSSRQPDACSRAAWDPEAATNTCTLNSAWTPNPRSCDLHHNTSPEQRLLLLAGVPQVLQEAKHDVGRAAAGAIPRRPRLLYRQRVVPQQLHQHAPALPVGVKGLRQSIRVSCTANGSYFSSSTSTRWLCLLTVEN